MRNDDQHELPETLRHLRQHYRAPQAPEGYLESLAQRVGTRTQPPARTRRLWPRLSAAAAVLLLLVAGWWFVADPATTVDDPVVVQEDATLSVEDAYYPEVDEDFLLSVVLLEAEDLVLPEEYMLEEEEELYLELF